MPILDIQPNKIGQAGVFPSIVFISTNDTLETVTETGYLNGVVEKFGIPLSESYEVIISTKTFPNAISTQVAAFGIVNVGDDWSLTGLSELNDVVLPTIANHIATYTNTEGQLSEDAATAINAGNIQAGIPGVQGALISMPAGVTNGSLQLVAVNNSGNTVTTITNAPMAEANIIFIPNPLTSSASFLLNTGPANTLTMQQFISFNNVFFSNPSTWTLTRLAPGNYAAVHAVTSEQPILGIDITPYLRQTANKGFSLQSIDFIYSIGSVPLVSQSAALYQVSYANNVPVATTAIPLANNLPLGSVQANPYVSNVAIATPGFLVTPDSKYNVELSLFISGLGQYSFYGINLNFQQTIA